MKKLGKRVFFCLLMALFIWCGTLIADRQRLNEELVRLHVVAASDSEEDQQRKLLVRDAIVDSLSKELENITDPEQARAYICEKLPKLKEIALSVLKMSGCDDGVTVSLEEEAFDTRSCEELSLPAGIYDTLRITIGRGNGKNWWCVIFPACCTGESEDFQQAAEAAGFPASLRETLTSGDGQKIRFFLLEVLGKLEQFLHRE